MSRKSDPITNLIVARAHVKCRHQRLIQLLIYLVDQVTWPDYQFSRVVWVMSRKPDPITNIIGLPNSREKKSAAVFVSDEYPPALPEPDYENFRVIGSLPKKGWKIYASEYPPPKHC